MARANTATDSPGGRTHLHALANAAVRESIAGKARTRSFLNGDSDIAVAPLRTDADCREARRKLLLSVQTICCGYI